MKKLFEYVIVYSPKNENDESIILIKPEIILADNEKIVQMEAVLSIPEEYKNKLSEINIFIRPF